jgi:hypothetical protein
MIISTFEEFVSRDGEIIEEIATKIEWAKAKADWLDPFVSKEDKYLDSSDKDEIIQPECSKKDTWNYPSYSNYQSTPQPSFWSNPWRNRH